MEKRTANIIMACKGNFKARVSGLDGAICYMSHITGTPKRHYVGECIESIMLEAMYDFIDTCDKPSVFLRNIYECKHPNSTLAMRISNAFIDTRVKNRNGDYVNGFSEELVSSFEE